MADIPDYDTLRRKARKKRRVAITDAHHEARVWYSAELVKLEAADLTISEFKWEKRELLIELGRRMNKGERDAKRENSLAKLMRRELRRSGPSS